MADEKPASRARIDLGADRAMLAHERTLMAWTRTATSLISFGFTIYTFFHTFNFGSRQESGQFFGAARYALAMICTGLIALVLATLRHWRDVREIEAEYGQKPRLLAPLLAGMIACLGIFGLLTVLLHD